MAEDNFEDKSEQATPKKRMDARKKGEVAKSRELPSVAVLLAGMMTFVLFGTFMYDRIQDMMITAFRLPVHNTLGVTELIHFAREMIQRFFAIMTPLAGMIVLAAVVANILQVGFMINAESLKPKFSKINPIKGFGRLFSKQSVMELLKSIFKLGIVGAVGYITIRGEMDNLHTVGYLPHEEILVYMFAATFKLFVRCALAMIVIVAIDYAFQKWQFEKKLKMSKKEVKDEHKESEGDPMIKSRIRSIQMQMARNRMMQNVPDADVVVTNPTHYAIALKYHGQSMGAPKVVAKGKGEIALKIKELAVAHQILMVENRSLAQTLYQMVEIDHEVPPLLYQAVAEVLAYVYKQKNR
jgi:flagellar biosynthesis protein FlhB